MEEKTINNVDYGKIEEIVCKPCKNMIKQKMMPIYKNINSQSKFRQAFGQAQLVKLQPTLWRKLCPGCIRKVKKQVL